MWNISSSFTLSFSSASVSRTNRWNKVGRNLLLLGFFSFFGFVFCLFAFSDLLNFKVPYIFVFHLM